MMSRKSLTHCSIVSVFALAWLLAPAVWGQEAAEWDRPVEAGREFQQDSPASRSPRDFFQAPRTIPSIPVNSGYVILDGQYLALPYVVAHDADHVFVNGTAVNAANLIQSQSSQERARSRRGRVETDPAGALHQRLQGRLMSNEVVVGLDPETVILLPFDTGVTILNTLVSDESDGEKVDALIAAGSRWWDRDQWERLVELFEKSPELSQRIEDYNAIVSGSSAVPDETFRSSSLQSLLTIAAMLSAVLALGTLLSRRPPVVGPWRDVNDCSNATQLVRWCVLFVVLFSALDLVCTIVADQAGGFRELNPLGNMLLQSTLVLIAFKALMTTMSAMILLKLRTFRGAQMASWWLCMLCTVLTFRWAAFASMFMA
jgi:hypothetical protein